MSVENFKIRLQIVIDNESSVNAFAKKCGCTEGALRKYLAGKSLPGLDNLVNIAKAANVSVDWLATGEGPPPEKKLNITLEKLECLVADLDEKSMLEILKYAEDKKEKADLKATLVRFMNLDGETIRRSGFITLNLLNVLALPPMGVLCLVGYNVISGTMALILLSKLYLLYLPAFVSLFIYRKGWLKFLKSRYVSFISFTDIDTVRIKRK